MNLTSNLFLGLNWKECGFCCYSSLFKPWFVTNVYFSSIIMFCCIVRQSLPACPAVFTVLHCMCLTQSGYWVLTAVCMLLRFIHAASTRAKMYSDCVSCKTEVVLLKKRGICSIWQKKERSTYYWVLHIVHLCYVCRLREREKLHYGICKSKKGCGYNVKVCYDVTRFKNIKLTKQSHFNIDQITPYSGNFISRIWLFSTPSLDKSDIDTDRWNMHPGVFLN